MTAQGEDLTFDVEAYLGGVDPSSVRADLCAEPKNKAPAFRQGMNLSAPPAVISGPHTFSTRTPATRDPADLTPRILPYHVLALPPQVRRILWQR